MKQKYLLEAKKMAKNAFRRSSLVYLPAIHNRLEQRANRRCR